MSLKLKLRRASQTSHFSIFFFTSPDQSRELEPRPRAPVEGLKLLRDEIAGKRGGWLRLGRRASVGSGVVGLAGPAGFSRLPRAPCPCGGVCRQSPAGLINANVRDVSEWGAGGKGLVLALPVLTNGTETAPNVRVNVRRLLTPPCWRLLPIPIQLHRPRRRLLSALGTLSLSAIAGSLPSAGAESRGVKWWRSQVLRLQEPIVFPALSSRPRVCPFCVRRKQKDPLGKDASPRLEQPSDGAFAASPICC